MSQFKVHTQETAPQDSRTALDKVKRSMGSIPNLLGVFSESPAMLEAYLALSEIFERQSGFDAAERQTVLLTASFFNDCRYCMAAHSVISKLQGVPADLIEALREGRQIANHRLEALRVFTHKVAESRGRIAPEDIIEFLSHGFGNQHILEVVLGVGLKTLSNYTNHIAETPLDPSFQPGAWWNPHSHTEERCELCDLLERHASSNGSQRPRWST